MMDPAQHTLTYPAAVDPRPGTILGPGLDGRLWKVLGTVHADGKAYVTFKEVT